MGLDTLLIQFFQITVLSFATFSIVMVFLLIFMPDIFERISQASNIEISTRLLMKPLEIPRDTDKKTSPHLRFLAFIIIIISLLSLMVLFLNRKAFDLELFIKGGKGFDWLAAILIQSSFLFFLVFLSFSILVGLFILLLPEKFPAFSSAMNKWISTRQIYRGLDVFLDLDSFLIRHHISVGIFSLLVLIYIVYACFFRLVNVQERFEGVLQHGSILAFVIAFFGGVGVSLTPCVYPVIPITIAYLGARQAQSRVQAFFISLSYVLGLAVTYTGLGAVSTLPGQFFGTVSTHWITNLLVGGIFVYLGLSMFDLFLVPIPAFLRTGLPGKASGKLRGTYLGSFIIGSASGLVVGTCTLPVLGTILAYIVSQEISFVRGALLLFSYSMGLGMIFLLAGTFSSLFTGLLKSGIWMNIVKKVMASAIILAGFYFIYQAIKFF